MEVSPLPIAWGPGRKHRVRELPPLFRLVLYELAQMTRPETYYIEGAPAAVKPGYVFTSIAGLAAATGLSHSHIKRALAELANKKLVRLYPGRFGTMIFVSGFQGIWKKTASQTEGRPSAFYDEIGGSRDDT